MKSIIYLTIALLFSVVMNSCKRVTEERTIELNQIFDMKAKKWYKCEIGQDSTFLIKIMKVEDKQGYGKQCMAGWGGTIKVYFKTSMKGVENDFELTTSGCSGEPILPIENPNLPNQNISNQVKIKLMKVYPLSSREDKKPSRLSLYDFKIVFYKP